MPWSDAVDAVLAGDLTAGLAYVTPAGGAVVTAVAPIGLRDRAAGTVGFTTSLGFGRKLDRIERNPRVALAYHSREHGTASDPVYVLVQGDAVPRAPDEAALEAIRPNVVAHLGEPKQGRLFWDRWLREYYADRVLVDVTVRRVVTWPALDGSGPPAVEGEPRPAPAPSQAPPAKGTEPRVDVAREAKRIEGLPHRLLAAVGGDGYPEILPFALAGADAGGLHLRVAAGAPPGARRAGLVAHRYRPELIGLATRQHTGWMEVDGDGHAVRYAPHTAGGFAAPPNKTLLLLGNGFLAKRGLRQARRAGRSV